jgi:hypothetical protein
MFFHSPFVKVPYFSLSSICLCTSIDKLGLEQHKLRGILVVGNGGSERIDIGHFASACKDLAAAYQAVTAATATTSATNDNNS